MATEQEALYNRIKSIYPRFLEDCGLAIGLGWYPLMASLLTELAEISKVANADFRATCVKEKFGSLRIYLNCALGGNADSNDIASLLVDLAEHLSGHICEVCGEPGGINNDGGWLRARCPTHKKGRIYDDDSYVSKKLLTAPLPEMDLALLPKIGRIECSSDDIVDDDSLLTIVTYRSLNDYSRATVSDIEIREEIGWFTTHGEARTAAKQLGCEVLHSRSVAGLKVPSKP